MSKVMSPREAVARHVRPGQLIHAGGGWGFPTALLYEIVRQFWGRDPEFTLAVAGAASTNVVPFLRGGLVRRVITSFAGDGYPHPGPNPVIQETRRLPAGGPGAVIFEDWSLLTFTLRLLAGAMGLPYLPTRSLVGSDLGRDLAAAGLILAGPEVPAGADPSGVGAMEAEEGLLDGEVALVRALVPDVSLAHAWAADEDGNALFTLPLAGNVYGALAAREGVILSVEHLLARDDLAGLSDLVRLPAHRVLAVVEAPYGSHPAGLHSQGLRGAGSGPDGPATRGYAEDRDFILEAREASRSPETADAWIRRWILELPDHQAYLERLGPDRLKALEERLAQDAWPRDLPAAWRDGTVPDDPPTGPERLICLAARVVAEEVRREGHPTILAGIGAAHLASWLARETLAAEGLEVDLMAEIGLVGHRPYPGDPFVFSLRNVPTAVLTSDILTVLGLLVPGAPGSGDGPARACLGVIGAAQVDREGNVNTSGLPSAGFWLVGSGGANDVASTAPAVVVVAPQSRTRFVSRVPYVTSPGRRVTAVVSQWGVYRRLEPGGEFALAAYYDDPADPGVEAGVRRARERCGWDLRVFPDPRPLPPPDPALVRRLRLFDPEGYFRDGPASPGEEYRRPG